MSNLNEPELRPGRDDRIGGVSSENKSRKLLSSLILVIVVSIAAIIVKNYGAILSSSLNGEGGDQDKISTLRGLYGRGDRLVDQGREREGLALYQKALDYGQSNFSVDDVLIGDGFYKKGGVEETLGNYADAESDLKRAIEIYKKDGVSSEIGLAAALDYLGHVYEDQAWYKKSEIAYLEALQIFEKRLGEQHPYDGGTHNNLGSLYLKMGNLASARRHLETALNILKKSPGQIVDVATVTNNLGDVALKEGQVSGAERLFKEAYEIRSKYLTPDNPDLAITLSSFTELFLKNRRLNDAAEFARKALIIREGRFGPNHPLVANTSVQLGRSFEGASRFDDATKSYRDALSIRETLLRSGHPDTIFAMRLLARTLVKGGSNSEAAQLEHEADMLAKLNSE